MQFSAYQIESMLDDYQQENFPSDRSASETLSLSEEAINEARQHFTPSASRASVWKSPKEVIELIEDKTAYDQAAKKLINLFISNFEQYLPSVDNDVKDALVF